MVNQEKVEAKAVFRKADTDSDSVQLFKRSVGSSRCCLSVRGVRDGKALSVTTVPGLSQELLQSRK
jgi:hypothetical protein